MGITQKRCLKCQRLGGGAGQAYFKPPLLLQDDSICLQQIPFLSIVQKPSEYPGPPTPAFVTPRR